MKNSGGPFQNPDSLQRRSGKLSFRDDGTGRWKTFLSSELEGPPAQLPKINPNIHLLLLHRDGRLSNWCVFDLLFFLSGREFSAWRRNYFTSSVFNGLLVSRTH